MKKIEYKVFNEEIVLSKNKIIFYKIYNNELYNTKIIMMKFQQKLNSYKNLEELIENIYYDSIMLIQERIELTLHTFKRLHNKDVSLKHFYKLLDRDTNLVYLIEEMENICDRLISECLEMAVTQEEKRLYRDLRKSNRSKVIGIGRGVKGFAKAQITAGVMNATYGGVHSIVNAIGNISTSVSIRRKKENLKNGDLINKKYRGLFNEALSLCVEQHYEIYNELHKYIDFSIFEDELPLLSYMTKEEKEINDLRELLYKFIEEDLTNEFIVKKILKNFGDSDGNFSKFIIDLGFDDKRIKKEILNDIVECTEKNIENKNDKIEYIESQINTIKKIKYSWRLMDNTDFIEINNKMIDMKIPILRKNHPMFMHLQDHIDYLNELKELEKEYVDFKSDKIKSKIKNVNETINSLIVVYDKTIKDDYNGVSIRNTATKKYQCKSIDEYNKINKQIEKIVTAISDRSSRGFDINRINCYKEICEIYTKYNLLENFIKYIKIYKNYTSYFNQIVNSEDLKLEEKYKIVMNEKEAMSNLYFQTEILRDNLIKKSNEMLDELLTVNGFKYESIENAIDCENWIIDSFCKFKEGIQKIYPDYFDNDNFMNFENLNNQNDECVALFNYLKKIGENAKKTDIVLQLAICYCYGFGTEPNIIKAKKILDTIKNNGFKEFHLAYILKQDPESWEKRFKSDFANKWLGHLFNAERYRSSIAIANAIDGDYHYLEIGYKHEKENVKKALECWKEASKYKNRYSIYRLNEYEYLNNKSADINHIYKELNYILKNHSPNDMVPIEKICHILYEICLDNNKITEAIKYLTLSCIYGSIEDQLILANYFMKGEYVEKDLSKSYYWYSKASLLGNEQATKVKIKLEKKNDIDNSKLEKMVVENDEDIIDSLNNEIIFENNNINKSREIKTNKKSKKSEKKFSFLKIITFILWKFPIIILSILFAISSIGNILSYPLPSIVLIICTINLWKARNLFDNPRKYWKNLILSLITFILFALVL